MFTLAADLRIRKIQATVTNGSTIDLTGGPYGDIIPYIVLASAPANSQQFTFVAETYFETDPIVAGVSYPLYGVTVQGESDLLDVILAKGTQVMICVGIKSTSPVPEGLPLIEPLVAVNGGIIAQL